MPIGRVDTDAKSTVYACGLLICQREMPPRCMFTEWLVCEVIQGNYPDSRGHIVWEFQPKQLGIEWGLGFGIPQFKVEVWTLRAARIAGKPNPITFFQQDGGGV